MATEQRFKVLNIFHDASLQLQALLRTGPALNEAEQLFIENCIMMTQIEYQQWGQNKYRDKRQSGRNTGESPFS
jgi:hypothetical protein